MKVRNTFIIFVVSGFWHGANWTFLAWGAINAIYFLPLLLLKRNRANVEIVAQGKFLPTIREISQIAITFGLTLLAWIFFRAENIEHAFSYISTIFSRSLFSVPEFFGKKHAMVTALIICVFTLIEWFGREEQHALAALGLKWRRPVRWAFYYSIIIVIYVFAGETQQFIYFQF